LKHFSGTLSPFYQVKDAATSCGDIRFRAIELGWNPRAFAVDHGNYDLAYTAPLTDKGDTEDRLEALWDRFNNDHPADYHRPSLSVSDIVALKAERRCILSLRGQLRFSGASGLSETGKLPEKRGDGDGG
jgi:hypothetical protein